MAPIEPKDTREHVLIFEPLSGGHRAEFVGHLLEYARRQGTDKRRYTFVVAGHFLDADLGILPENVSFEAISCEWKTARFCSWMAGFGHWKVLRHYAEKLRPDRIILMDLTCLELPLCLRRPPCPFSGILMVQYPELQWIKNPGVRSRMKFRLKECKTSLLLRNPMVKSIHLLNGARASDYLNRRFSTSVFRPLQDPVDSIEPEFGYDLHATFSIENDRTVFLFFGSMSARKGVGPLVEAIIRLGPECRRKASFVFCGRPEPGFAESYRGLIADLRKRCPDIDLHVDESFVPRQRMRAMFVQADWILLPNMRPEYSSGVLGHAVSAGTPVIGLACGVVGRQIQENGFGLVTKTDPASLSEAILRAFSTEAAIKDKFARERFLDASTPDRFASFLLDGHP